jgi:FkbM family methyltransferase
VGTIHIVIINYSSAKTFVFGRRFLRFFKSIFLSSLLSLLKLILFLVKKLPFGFDVISKLLEFLWEEKLTIDTPNGKVLFQTPTSLNRYRAQTLLTKEPETIFWLDEIPFHSCLWDIGANVGIYSVYAALFRHSRVIAVEPSSINLDLLFRNIQNNKCEDSITILPIAVGSSNSQEFLYMSRENLTWGGAHNSAGQPVMQSGEPMHEPVKSLQLVATIDQLIQGYKIAKPEYIKIDVDGLELNVLIGAHGIFPNLKSILIEIDIGNQKNLSLVEEFLESHNFVKRTLIGSVVLSENQIWDKV